MKLRHIMLFLPALFTANVHAEGLPDLGDVSQATISPREERELGLKIMSEIRSDPSYLNDAEIDGYLTRLGSRLISGSNEARPEQEFEFFLPSRTRLSMHLHYREVSWDSIAG